MKAMSKYNCFFLLKTLKYREVLNIFVRTNSSLSRRFSEMAASVVRVFARKLNCNYFNTKYTYFHEVLFTRIFNIQLWIKFSNKWLKNANARNHRVCFFLSFWNTISLWWTVKNWNTWLCRLVFSYHSYAEVHTWSIVEILTINSDESCFVYYHIRTVRTTLCTNTEVYFLCENWRLSIQRGNLCLCFFKC